MLKHVKIRQLDDFFIELQNRADKGVYFYRINGYNEQINTFIMKYYEAARKYGVIIEGRIPNPSEGNLAYYNEIMGADFSLDNGFISNGLKKWLPRMNDYQRNAVSSAIFDTLSDLKNNGKSESVLKNTYVKFMCWLYYKFERIIGQLGADAVPKVMYEGDISSYELMLIRVLVGAGCDVVLLQYNGDENYLKLDPQSLYSENLNISNMGRFPDGFDLKKVRQDIQTALNNERLYGTRPTVVNCTNAWIDGKGLDDFKVPVLSRGNNPELFYNCYCRINGVDSKATYLSDLYQFQLEIKTNERRLVIIDNEIPQPDTTEINGIRRNNYLNTEQMIQDLSINLQQYSQNIELQRLMVKSFVDVMLEESKAQDMNLHKLTNKAVYLLCWLRRYYDQLFSKWKMPELGVFIYLGGCKTDSESLFIKFLARLPVDVLILVPNLNTKCSLTDSLLFEVNYRDSLVVDNYPHEASEIQMGTVAYYAERELDDIMYQDSGMYRNRQYDKATAVSLRTMYEEIVLLWHQEMKYRPNFSTAGDMVTMPVIFAKVSGVKDKDKSAYWLSIRQLITPETVIVGKRALVNPYAPNPFKDSATEFLINGKLQRDVIKKHKSYKFDVLIEEVQERILDKLQLLIDQKNIKGTFEDGTEYLIVSTILNLDRDLVRSIQNFDFTKMNPKVIYINTTEKSISLEDTIVLAFLNLIGFDVIFFVPTGYRTVDKYFNKKIMDEHQIGDFMYDLTIPRLTAAPPPQTKKRNNIFKRGK